MAVNTGQMMDKTDFAQAVAAVLSAGDVLGCTTDEIADALHLPKDGAALQQELEEMVYEGILDRRGVGRGALYTLIAPVRLSKGSAAGGSTATNLKEPAVRKAG